MSRFHPLFQNARAYMPLGRRSAVVTIQLLAACHLLTTDVLEIRLCAGFSMLPTFSHSGDFVLISPIPAKLHQTARASAAEGRKSDVDASWWRGIRRGDVVVATSPTDPGKTVCKRVLAIEGDIIEVDPARMRTASTTGGLGEKKALSAAQQRQASRSFSPGKDDPSSLRVIPEEWPALVDDDARATNLGIHIDPNALRRGAADDSSPAARYDRRNARRWEEADADHRQAERERQTVPAREDVSTLGPAVFPSSHPRTTSSTHLRIPRGYVWLAGDNASNSTDSRAYGPVPLGLVKGKVLARAWPRPTWIAGSDDGMKIIKDFDE